MLGSNEISPYSPMDRVASFIDLSLEELSWATNMIATFGKSSIFDGWAIVEHTLVRSWA